MFLKVYWNNKIKKINFSAEMNDYEKFCEQLSSITRISKTDMIITFVDMEEEKLEINDALDFEYFLKATEEKKFTDIFVCSKIKDIQANLDQQTSQILEQMMNQFEESNNKTQALLSSDANNLTNHKSFVQQSLSTPQEESGIQGINTNLRPKGKLAFYRGLEEFINEKEQPIIQKNPEQVLPKSTPLEKINTELRPYRQLPYYRGLGEFLQHFDEGLKFKSEQPIKKIHSGVTCDSCQEKNITGKRFKCLVCIDFDICEKCEIDEKHSKHPMIRCAGIECNKILHKLNKKFLKYKKKSEKKSNNRDCSHEGMEHCRYRKDKIKKLITKTIVPAFKNCLKTFESHRSEETKAEVSNNENFSQSEMKIESENVDIGKLRSEKIELLNFMFQGAEKEVIEEMVRRFEHLNLTEFCEEIEKNNAMFDNF